MNIEFLDFYLNIKEKKYMSGSLSIRLPDIGITIKGISVNFKKNIWYIHTPSKVTCDHETCEVVRYPIFSFSDIEKHHEFKRILREKAPEYILFRLTDKENPLKLPALKKLENKED